MGINEYVQIGKKLKVLRKEKGIKQNEMAKLLGLSQSTYSNYENGYREPSEDIILKAAEILGVTIDFLLQNIFSDFKTFDDYTKQLEKDMDSLDDETAHNAWDEYQTIFYGSPKEEQNDDWTEEELEEIERFKEFVKSKRKDTEPDYLTPKAAHERTDIKVTDEMREHDNKIMEDDDF